MIFSRISINQHGTRGLKRRILSDQFRVKHEKLRGSKYITRILEKKKVLLDSPSLDRDFCKACLQVECRTCSASWPNLGWSWWESAMQHPGKVTETTQRVKGQQLTSELPNGWSSKGWARNFDSTP